MKMHHQISFHQRANSATQKLLARFQTIFTNLSQSHRPLVKLRLKTLGLLSSLLLELRGHLLYSASLSTRIKQLGEIRRPIHLLRIIKDQGLVNNMLTSVPKKVRMYQKTSLSRQLFQSSPRARKSRRLMSTKELRAASQRSKTFLSYRVKSIS